MAGTARMPTRSCQLDMHVAYAFVPGTETEGDLRARRSMDIDLVAYKPLSIAQLHVTLPPYDRNAESNNGPLDPQNSLEYSQGP
jgi:hypothetical protein